MQVAARTCPTCHAVVEAEARFCPNGCGRLPAAGAARATAVSTPSPAAQGFSVAWAHPEANWYNLSLKQANRTIIRFRYSADDSQYGEILELTVKINGKAVCQTRQLACRGRMSVPWVPDMAGEDSLSVSAVCRRLDGGLDEYSLADELPLLVDAVLDNGTVNVQLGNTSINNTSDRAGDSSVVFRPEFNMQNIHFDPNAPRYRTDTGRFAPLQMEVVKRTEPPPPAPPSPACITLRDGERVVQLTSLKSLVFGKEREKCDYALRVFDAAGMYCRRESGAISRRHFRVACYARGCFLEDLKSTFGTEIDGADVGCRLTWLVPDAKHVVRLCGRARTGGVLSLSVRVYSGRTEPVGIVVDRSDGARQRILAIWGPEGIPFDGCGNSVALEAGRFVARTSDGKTMPVVVGETVRIGSRTYVVEDFNQPFSHGK